MREIKFRVWDEEEKEMKYFDLFNMHGWGDGTVYLSSEHCTRGDEINNFKYSVMQYTGLKDTKGVEIYEGDIVSFGDGRFISVVVFDNNEWCVNVKTSHPNATYYAVKGFNMFNWKDYEVIANIYENLELLKGEEK